MMPRFGVRIIHVFPRRALRHIEVVVPVLIELVPVHLGGRGLFRANLMEPTLVIHPPASHLEEEPIMNHLRGNISRPPLEPRVTHGVGVPLVPDI